MRRPRLYNALYGNYGRYIGLIKSPRYVRRMLTQIPVGAIATLLLLHPSLYTGNKGKRLPWLYPSQRLPPMKMNKCRQSLAAPY